MKTYTSNMHLFQNSVIHLKHEPEFKCKPRGMFIHEDIGWRARIENPRDRLIYSPLRKWDIVYGLGEFLWYVTGSESLKMISYYAPSYDRFSDDGETLYGAYGPRIFGEKNKHSFIFESGWTSIIDTLKRDPDSRQAISLIWREKDMHKKDTKDYPCTVYLQFFVREEKLCMISNMRSNDVWLGIPNDIFCFTMLQELMAFELGLEMGFYQHNDGSLHMYENTLKKLDENPQQSLYAPSWINHKQMEMNLISNFADHLVSLIQYEEMARERTILNPLDLSDGALEVPIAPCYGNISSEIKDLMWVLYYGKARKILKKNDNKLFQNALNLTLENIKQDCIKNCILVYEGVVQ